MIAQADLLAVLRRHWGYDSFLPLQESIVRGLLEGRDSYVVMPTGGGKSLCYQLPATISSGQTVIVISPLIALMQDQVTQLAQMGIPSAALNSSLTGAEQSAVMRNAAKGEYRLLYLSPWDFPRPGKRGTRPPKDPARPGCRQRRRRTPAPTRRERRPCRRRSRVPAELCPPTESWFSPRGADREGIKPQFFRG